MDYEKADDYSADLTAIHKPRVLPWILTGLSVIGGGAASLMLWMRLEGARGEAVMAKIGTDRANAERAELSQRLEKMETEKADLLALRNELSLQVQSKDEELSKLQGTYQELEVKMQEEIAKGDIRLSQAGGRIKVDLVDKILFNVGDASITEKGAGVLSRVGAVLANVEEKKIQVSGHTDNQPISDKLRDRYPTNWELASARASNVVRYLEEKAHVPGRRLVAAAYGPWEPISSNRTASGRARNRRIEIVLTPALAPIPVEGEGAAPTSQQQERPAKAPKATRPATPAAKKRRP